MKHWSPHDLALLRTLRERFLNGTVGAADYWRSEQELALYDATFAERIGWKWDAVLRELARRGWRPRGRRIVDWGCGSGIAGRRVAAAMGGCDEYAPQDRSRRAMEFASSRMREAFPSVRISHEATVDAQTLLVVSHVLSELSEAQFAELLALASQAGEVLWVEPGTHAESRRLIAAREALRAHSLQVIAPCTHAAQCGLLAPENARHWCHHFARVPSEIFQDARWREFGVEMGIDLRSLPYSFLVMAREAAPAPDGLSRVIGEAREFKGYAKVLSCQSEGVHEFMLQKRDAPALHKAVLRAPEAPLFRWEITDGRITGGEPARGA